MVGNSVLVPNNVKIVNEDGTPSEFWIRWCQERQISIGDSIDEAEAIALIEAWSAERNINVSAPITGGGDLSSDITIGHANSGVTPGSYTSTNLTVDAFGHITAASSGAGGGGWTLVSTTTVSSPAPNFDIPSLGSYNEILVVGRLLTMSTTGFRFCRLSVDNGATFYSTSGNYINLDTNGVETNGADVGGHNTTASAARTILMNLQNNLSGGVKLIRSVTVTTAPNQLFVASTLPVNAVRVMCNTGNITGGTIYVFGR